MELVGSSVSGAYPTGLCDFQRAHWHLENRQRFLFGARRLFHRFDNASLEVLFSARVTDARGHFRNHGYEVLAPPIIDRHFSLGNRTTAKMTLVIPSFHSPIFLSADDSCPPTSLVVATDRRR